MWQVLEERQSRAILEQGREKTVQGEASLDQYQGCLSLRLLICISYSPHGHANYLATHLLVLSDIKSRASVDTLNKYLCLFCRR